ncbi:MAG: 2-succinyl-5-enolpyruvyl-6-hydroxy-3-cyclohexene-1-carboxylic-acid synthase, partial [Actinomycetota bacterium]
MSRDAGTAFARAVVDEWVRNGVAHACVAPGSRSTPMAHALAHDGRVAVHVFLDERSAAFAAVGIGRATGRPAVVLCTSGTATANFHPAVLEADLGRVPLVVATADRPPELRHVGAPQTVDQTSLYGDAVRWFVDLGPPEDLPGAGAWWRATAARTVAVAAGPPAGPVHWNLPFREPLVPTGAPLVDAEGHPDGAPWTVSVAPVRTADRDVATRVAA